MKRVKLNSQEQATQHIEEHGTSKTIISDIDNQVCHDPDASGHETCITTVCLLFWTFSYVPLVPFLSVHRPSHLIYDNTLLDPFRLCLPVS